MPKRQPSPADYIVPLDMNGLSGRMLYMPGPKDKKAEILFIYGQHSSIERWWGLLQYANRYGAVTALDLPGFGGMQSFYKIGEKPTLDNFADYLAAFIKMRYKRKRVVIVGMSLGFVVATRMLQRCPELTKNVRMLVSLVGLMHADDLRFSTARYRFYKTLGHVMSYWPPAFLFRAIAVHRVVFRLAYHRTYLSKSKFQDTASVEERNRLVDAELELWRINDVRTHGYTTYELLTLNNCDRKINLPVWHIDVKSDQYFDHQRVSDHMEQVFTKVYSATAPLKTHAPSIIADEETAAQLMPAKLRRALRGLK